MKNKTALRVAITAVVGALLAIASASIPQLDVYDGILQAVAEVLTNIAL